MVTILTQNNAEPSVLVLIHLYLSPLYLFPSLLLVLPRS